MTVAVPTAATSVAGITASRRVDATKLVVRGLPFHKTVAPGRKFLPKTVMTKSLLPNTFAPGESPVSSGVRLMVTGKVKFVELIVPPEMGFETDTLTSAAFKISPAAMAACN